MIIDQPQRPQRKLSQKQQTLIIYVALSTVVLLACSNYTWLFRKIHNDFQITYDAYNDVIHILDFQNEGWKRETQNLSNATYNNNVLTSWQQFLKDYEIRNNKSNNEIVEFERQEGVVIATKLHGIHQLFIMEQSLCLLHYAYNNRVHYDIIAFTTDPINDTLLEPLRASIAPAKFTLVVDNRGLQEEIRVLSPIRRTKFLERCNVSSPENITWWSECPGRVAYNWQAEFRAWHIWKHPALQPYKYMMWLDTDAFPAQAWDRDPVAFMIQNKLFMLFDNFPQGRNSGEEIQNRIVKSFNQTLCGIRLKNGTLESHVGGDCPRAQVPLIHGFFHITDLDFYRSDIVQWFAENWIGDCFLCREYDDQAGVTIPVAMLAPERAWDMRSHGIHLNVFHNFYLDGKDKVRPKPNFVKFWANNGSQIFPEAWGKCPVQAGD